MLSHSYSVVNENHLLMTFNNHKKACRVIRFAQGGTELYCIVLYYIVNLLAIKQSFAEIGTTYSGTIRNVETFTKNILIFSHVCVCHPNATIPILSGMSVCIYGCFVVGGVGQENRG